MEIFHLILFKGLMGVAFFSLGHDEDSLPRHSVPQLKEIDALNSALFRSPQPTARISTYTQERQSWKAASA